MKLIKLKETDAPIAIEWTANNGKTAFYEIEPVPGGARLIRIRDYLFRLFGVSK
ncbi:MAG: hypothetical protein JXR97_03745 [Planctomycetes bacterium]|nr:hypothetical protein [Planctomycetota bacterium]